MSRPRSLVLVPILLWSALPLRGQTAADSAAIRRTALDYIEGWYTGDADRMARALHPELAKRMVYTDPTSGRSRLEQQGAMTLVQATRDGYGRGTPQSRRLEDVTILDVFRNAASVKVGASHWIDYLHLARWDGEWKIVNVLWELKADDAPTSRSPDGGGTDLRTLVDEAWRSVDSTYWDPTFGGLDWAGVRSEYRARDYGSRKEAYRSIRGMLRRLGDPATRFLDPEQAEGLLTEFAGRAHEGVGLLEVLSLDVDEETGAIVVVTPVPGGPAARAGLRPGDVVRSVDGASAPELGLEGVMSRLRGTAGTSVALTIRRHGETLPLRVRRERIPAIDPVVGFVRNEAGVRIGYLGLRQFTPESPERLRALVDSLGADGVDGWILDLRDDPGGYVTAVEEIAGLFLGAMPIARLHDRSAEPTPLQARGDRRIQGPVAVLVNEGSASAAEVLAGAFQDHRRGPVVGTHTFGKGLAHGFQRLSDGSAVVPTLGRLETLGGRDILDQGIEPDVAVPSPVSPVLDEAVEVATPRDVQYVRAVALLVESGRGSGS